jgi:hypothetical protein
MIPAETPGRGTGPTSILKALNILPKSVEPPPDDGESPISLFFYLFSVGAVLGNWYFCASERISTNQGATNNESI